MNQFPRAFKDDPAAFADALVRHARDDGPSAEARDRILAQVAAAGAVGAGAGLLAATVANQGATVSGAAVSSAKVGALVVTKWALAGVVAATAVLGVREAVVRHDDAPPTSQVERAAPQKRGAQPTRAAQPMGAGTADRATDPSLGSSPAPSIQDEPRPSPTNVAPALRDPALSEESHARPASRAPRVDKEARDERARDERARDEEPSAAPLEPAPAPVADPVASAAQRTDVTAQLSRELGYLERARAQLRQQFPVAALDALNDYERAFPSGTMKVEASALRVEALVEAGRRDDAIRLGRAFLAAYPRNPMAHRVRAFLVRLDATPQRP